MKKLLIMLLVLTMVLSIVMLTACFETGEEETPTGTDIVDDVVVDVDTPSEDTTLDGSTTLWTATLAYTEAQTEYGYEGTFEEFLASLAGITAVNLSTDGDLIITLGDGSTLNVGNVMGETGATGSDGVGISSMVINDDGDLIITFSNGTDVNAGSVYATQPTEQAIVTYDANGGTLSSDSTTTVDSGSKLAAPSDPTLDGYTFDGWYCGDTLWVFVGYTVTEDITLTAQWVATLEYQLNDDGVSYSVVGIGSATNTSAYILSSYNNLPVTSIADRAFYECSQISSIEIPASIVTIGENAFNYCWSFSELTFAEGSQLETISNSAFYDCHILNGIEIPSTVTSIGDNAFYNCYNLESVTFAEGSQLEVIGSYAFYCCYDICIEIPASVTDIGDGAFESCSNSNNLTFAEGSQLETIGNNTFKFCRSLTSIVVPDSITSIGDYAFSSCASLLSIEIPASVTSVGDYAFSQCENLTSVAFGADSQLQTIGSYAFIYCSGITSIVIPSKVTSIGDRAFYYCSNLLEIYNLSDLEIVAGSTDNGSVAYYAAVVFEDLSEVGTLSTDSDGFTTYTYSDNVILMSYSGDGGAISIPDGVTYIRVNVFEGNATITSVVISSSVTSIGDQAFYDCYKLVEVYNLSSLNITAGSSDNGYVAYQAVLVYDNLSAQSVLSTDDDGFVTYTKGDKVVLVAYRGDGGDIIIPAGVTEIRYKAFYANETITSVVIPEGVTDIYNEAFMVCVNLTSVVIPATVTAIYEQAFSWCMNLASVTFAEDSQLETICDATFYMCYSLTSIEIPASVTSISSYAFYECYNLIEVYNLSELNITVGSDDNGMVAYYARNVYTATEGQSKLSTDDDGFVTYTDGDDVILVGYVGTATDITVPNSVTEIHQYAFCYNGNITSVVIGDNVTYVGVSAFYGCSNLTSVIFSDTTTWYVTYSESDAISMTGGTELSVSDSSAMAEYVIAGGNSFKYLYKVD